MMKRTFLIYSFIVLCSGDTVNRLRGVPLSMVSLYPPEGSFTCFDGSLTVPFDHVNDDYCDCNSDGTDEPGTSACPNGSFYCSNKGHTPGFIPSSRVNDGICDCCDGSDEYEYDVNCPNNCYELGKIAREEEARKFAMFKEGSKLRAELSLKGKQIEKEKQLRLLELRKEQSEAENMKNEKESIKDKIEERETAALNVYKQEEEENRRQKEEEDRMKNEAEALIKFKELDVNGDGFLEKSELLSYTLIDENKDGEVSDDEIKLLLNEDKISFESFLTSGWLSLKQLLVVKEIKETTGLGKSKVIDEEDDEQKLDDSSPEDEDNEERSTEHSEELDSNENEDRDDSADSHKIEYDEETQKLIEEANHARQEYDESVRNLRDIQREIRQIEEALNKNYGKEDEFAYLVGECFKYTDREYTYKLCPFDQVSQSPKDGGTETSLGSWGSWQDDKYQVMLYENGQSCWNGPQRSTKVKLSCSSRTEIVAASEPNRCEYALEFNTPALCVWNESQENSDDQHDEL